MSENLRYALVFIALFTAIGYFGMQAVSLGMSRAWQSVGSQVAEVAR